MRPSDKTVAAPVPGVGVRAIGRHLPDRVVTNAELESVFQTSDAWIRERLGIETRRISASDEWSSDLGAKAIRDACQRAGVAVDSVDLVVCGTVTPDHMVPTTASAIMRKMDLEGTPGFDVNSAGCSGGVFALDVGTKFVASGQYRRVAVVLTDVLSKMLDPTDRSVGVIFGDGASCYLLEPTTSGRGIGPTVLQTDSSAYWTIYSPRESRVAADGTPLRSGFGDNFVYMDGPGVKKFVAEVIPGFIEEFADSSGIALDQVDLFVMHQANLNLVHAILDGIGQPRTKTVTNVQTLGNTSGASVPLVLRQAEDSGRLRPGDLVLAVAFGAGLNYGATAINWCGDMDFAQG